MLVCLLAIAYHPNLSPVAMPLSVLVLATLAVIVLVASALSLRWHYQKLRELKLSQLQEEIAVGIDKKEVLEYRKEQLESLSEGVFRPWNRSPIGWILGGGATLALVDLWVRSWTVGL